MIYDPYYECMDLEQRRALQLRRLRDMVARLAVNVPHYMRAFAEIDFSPGDLKSLEDMARLPFVDKFVLRDNYPLQLLAVPESEVVPHPRLQRDYRPPHHRRVHRRGYRHLGRDHRPHHLLRRRHAP